MIRPAVVLAAAAVFLTAAAANAAPWKGPNPPPNVRVPDSAKVICTDHDWKDVDGGRYILRLDVFPGFGGSQCISNSGDGPNFTITKARFKGIGWWADDKLFQGCLYSVCTSKKWGPLPERTSAVLNSRVRYSFTGSLPASYTGNESADLYFNQKNIWTGQATGAELMAWWNERDEPWPASGLHHTGTVRIDGIWWEWYKSVTHSPPGVLCSDTGLPGCSWTYLRIQPIVPRNRVSPLPIALIIRFFVRKGFIKRWWYLGDLDIGGENTSAGVKGYHISDFRLFWPKPVTLLRTGPAPWVTQAVSA